MKTATESLRQLLDERDVKWVGKRSRTDWSDDIWEFEAVDFGGDTICLYATHHDMITPAQAVEATLGRGECEIKERDNKWYCTGCGDSVGTSDPDSESCVSDNVVELWDFCPYCGRKVKR